MGNDNKNNISNLDDEKQESVLPLVKPDQDLQSYEEKGFTPEKENQGSSEDKK